MAARQNRPDYRQQYRRGDAASQMYVQGNVVTKPAEEPRRHEGSSVRHRKASRQVRKNRKLALRMNSAYVIFLAVAAVMALVVCVNYIELQSRITMDSVNLDEIRDRAQNELGMVYASPERIVGYESPATDYVKKYEDIPEDGVLARSGKNNR